MEVRIRQEEATDAPAIRSVLRAAFGQPLEADLVEALRRDPAYRPELSLVAEDGGEIVGHVILTEMRLEDDPRPDLLALGPIAVVPERQRRGVGSALMREAISRAEAAKASAVVLLGEPEYYRRFGFHRGSKFGISSPPYPDAYLQVLPLGGFGEGLRGRVRYAPPFDDLEGES